MDSKGIFILVCIVVVFGSILFSIYFSNHAVVLRKLKKFKSKSVAQVQQGKYVKLFGKAQAGDVFLTAPLSKRKCVYYKVEVTQKSGKSRRTIIEEERIQDFILNVKGELVLIKPKGNFKKIKSYIVEDAKYSSGLFNEAPQFLENFLKSHDKKSYNLLGFNKDLRFKEAIIELEEPIAVLGNASWKRLTENIEGYNYSKILELEGTLDKKLVITDDPEGLKDKS